MFIICSSQWLAPYDRNLFGAALAKAGSSGAIELTFLESSLDRTPAVLATRYDVVCIFINGKCDADVLQ